MTSRWTRDDAYQTMQPTAGRSDDPVVGWITNDIINENAKV